MRTNDLSASFRDPSGFLFSSEGVLYRQVNQVYGREYQELMESGLYERLVKSGLLISHEEVDIAPADAEKYFKVIRPEKVQFISYPYEWSFGQLKDAALATLSIQKRAMKHGMSLKDASAYNIQFQHGKPILIDTLSFQTYQQGEPWVAYRQFCQHFLAPLALMAYRDVRLGQLLRIYIDGIPLDIASKLLPGRTRLNVGLFTHIHLHARAQKQYADVAVANARHGRSMSQNSLLGLIESLRNTIKSLEWKPSGTEWADYYEDNNYTDFAFEHKKELVADWIDRITPQTVWDLGANTGVFSRIAGKSGAYVVSTDIDPSAVEANYQQLKKDKESNLLPLVLDLTNPSPSIGWNNNEREAFLQRGPVDCVLALALVHHMAIANNVPLLRLANFFASCGGWLIVEFVPKTDSQVQRLLRSRADIFVDYTKEGFEKAFSANYRIQECISIKESDRWLYLMKRN
jgi:hypothetical protein